MVPTLGEQGRWQPGLDLEEEVEAIEEVNDVSAGTDEGRTPGTVFDVDSQLGPGARLVRRNEYHSSFEAQSILARIILFLTMWDLIGLLLCGGRRTVSAMLFSMCIG